MTWAACPLMLGLKTPASTIGTYINSCTPRPFPSQRIPPLPAVSLLLIRDRQIWYVCIGLLIIYGYILFCMTCVLRYDKNEKKWRIRTPLRRNLGICRSTMPLFKTAILLNIQLILLPWQPYICLFVWENAKRVK